MSFLVEGITAEMPKQGLARAPAARAFRRRRRGSGMDRGAGRGRQDRTPRRSGLAGTASASSGEPPISRCCAAPVAGQK